MGTYFTILTCRNSENDIEKALRSISDQTIKPSYIIVIDDGSTDNTASILEELSKKIDNLFIVNNPDLGYDISRVVKNWNKALAMKGEKKLSETDYHMIATDDTIYDRDYAEKIITFMDDNINYAVVSGNFDDSSYRTPRGAGRFVRNSFFYKEYIQYPEKMGYESAILIASRKNGYKETILKEAKFEHTRPLGQNHHFYEFGASMRTLGYHPLFALGRFFLYFGTSKPIGRVGALYMLYYYISYKPKLEGYDSMYPDDIRKYTRKTQIEKIKSLIKPR
ncbi:MAG TPA: glycosyltransferase family A protein [Candidatus Nitrosocosmicus sp.]|nr:glycosyltransferase family A protein [Candidatus Nitrosocosmicus sp.]